MLRTRRIVNLLLLVYFFIYAVSPLSLTIRTAHRHAISAPQSGLSIKGSSLVLLEILLDAVSPEDDEDDLPPADETTILVKKKRMLLSSADAIKQAIHLSEYAKTFDVPVVPEEESFYPVVPENRITLHQGFHPLYSGTSPPSV